MGRMSVVVLLPDDRHHTPEELVKAAYERLLPYERHDYQDDPGRWHRHGYWDFCYEPDEHDLVTFQTVRPPESEDSNWEVCPVCWGEGTMKSGATEAVCSECNGSGVRPHVWSPSPEIVTACGISPAFHPSAVVAANGQLVMDDEEVAALFAEDGSRISVLFSCRC